METVVTLTERQDVHSKRNGSRSLDIKTYRVELNVEEEYLDLVVENETFRDWVVGYYQIKTIYSDT